MRQSTTDTLTGALAAAVLVPILTFALAMLGFYMNSHAWYYELMGFDNTEGLSRFAIDLLGGFFAVVHVLMAFVVCVLLKWLFEAIGILIRHLLT